MSRYIDAEELKHIVNNSKYYGTERQRDFCDMITEAPAADVEPVRHGKWIKDGCGNLMCSECKSYALDVMAGCFANRYLEQHCSKYCPNCGALMREDGENGDK